MDEIVSKADLANWLCARLDGATHVEVLDFSEPKSGYSATTIMFDAAVTSETGDATNQRFVLRMETPEEPTYPVQVPGTQVEISVQYRVMESLQGNAAVPLAPLYGFEFNPDVLGAPFFVMGFISGEVPVEDPNYTAQGFFVDATPEQRTRMINNGIKVMAGIHSTPWEEAGLGWLVPKDGASKTPGTEAQMNLWQSLGERELAGRSHPNLEAAWAWLRSNLPTGETLTINWGDARLGNIIWQDFVPAAVTDFEASSIGPAELDLGWWLMFHRWSHETMGGQYLPGEPSRAEMIAQYESAAGVAANNVDFHEFFAAARYCVIVIRVMNRLVERGVMPEDHDIWLNNPASELLDIMMAEMSLL